MRGKRRACEKRQRRAPRLPMNRRALRLVHLRHGVTHDVLACWFVMDRATATRTIGKVRPLLAERDCKFEKDAPTGTRRCTSDSARRTPHDAFGYDRDNRWITFEYDETGAPMSMRWAQRPISNTTLMAACCPTRIRWATSVASHMTRTVG
ncbi:helix-turn-helix domain-containing protein [Streptomyces sp. NPDC055663]